MSSASLPRRRPLVGSASTDVAIAALGLFLVALIGWALAERRIDGLIARSQDADERAADLDAALSIATEALGRDSVRRHNDAAEITALREENSRLWVRNCRLQSDAPEPISLIRRRSPDDIPTH